MKISIDIFEDAESWLRENIQDFIPDNVCAIQPKSKINFDGKTTLEDNEEETTKVVTKQDWLDALKILCQRIGTNWVDEEGKEQGLFVGGINNPQQLTYAGNWDIEVVDAFYQLAYRKEVIYG